MSEIHEQKGLTREKKSPNSFILKIDIPNIAQLRFIIN